MYPRSEAMVILRRSQFPFLSNRNFNRRSKHSPEVSFCFSKIMPNGRLAPVDTAVCATIPFLFALLCVVYLIPNKSSLFLPDKLTQILSSSSAIEIFPGRLLTEMDLQRLFTISSRCSQIHFSRLPAPTNEF